MEKERQGRIVSVIEQHASGLTTKPEAHQRWIDTSARNDATYDKWLGSQSKTGGGEEFDSE